MSVAEAGGGVFVDTNVFVYAADARDQVKRRRARDVIDEYRRFIVVSTQVLLEFHAVATRKLALDADAARDAVQALATFPVVAADRELILDAVNLARTEALSVFDAAIVQAAARAGCEVLLSEDLTDGQVIGGVRVQNPFA